MIGEDFF